MSATLGWGRFFAFALAFVFWFLVFAGGGGWSGLHVFSLASALCIWFASVAPVRGGTYFSLPPQRKVGKRKRLTPPVLVFA
ncbi:hypothetical protein [Paraburkholderia terrae]|uniref:hypothetical protein n=1 Tax=Paraburkholderia terrae TaxID=311230 RepID=UPI001EE2AFD7|nr:hypothetical protein [Paraburkholderia terrae]GJH06628.1 hypothetical protein CBA19C8_38745 [Paraburkholderia terrae]